MFLFENIIPENKRLNISLKSCLGFGFTSGKLVFSKLGFNLNNGKIKTLNSRFLKYLTRLLTLYSVKLLKLCVGVEKKNQILFDLKRIRKEGTFRSIRHFQGLPVRNQRTRTNARTQKSRKGLKKKNLPVPGKKKLN